VQSDYKVIIFTLHMQLVIWSPKHYIIYSSRYIRVCKAYTGNNFSWCQTSCGKKMHGL